MLPNRKNELERFLDRLEKKEIADRTGAIVSPYYELESDLVLPSIGGLGRARVLCLKLLAEKGLVENGTTNTGNRLKVHNPRLAG